MMSRNGVQLNPGVDLSEGFLLQMVSPRRPFPTAPHRTVLAPFKAHGSPVPSSLSSSFVITHRCIAHHFLVYLPWNLLPCPLCLAFPGSLVGRCSSEYYGSSVARGSSPVRRSRIPVKLDVSTFRPCLSSNPFVGGHSPQLLSLCASVVSPTQVIPPE
jgi:hypothetical protein